MVNLVCTQCGAAYQRKQSDAAVSRYCSNSCRCKGSSAKKKWIDKECLCCGIPYRVEPCFAVQSKFCSRACYYQANKGENHNSWKGGTGWYKKQKGERCERCGADQRRLQVHHKDQDRSNNDLSNLETLCVPCHRKHHHSLKPKKPRLAELFPQQCRWCQKQFIDYQRRQRFCSRRCAGLHQHNGPPD